MIQVTIQEALFLQLRPLSYRPPRFKLIYPFDSQHETGLCVLFAIYLNVVLKTSPLAPATLLQRTSDVSRVDKGPLVSTMVAKSRVLKSLSFPMSNSFCLESRFPPGCEQDNFNS